MSSDFHKLPLKRKLKLWFLTLFYHSSFSFDYCVDVAVEPLFWFVDHFTKFLGKFFVALVCFLVSLVTFVAHVLGIPFYVAKSPLALAGLVVLGYWILINIIFNFYEAATVSPGVPADMNRVGVCSVTVCKICISPKPLRTHHCSICKRCFLKMDHHCPWVNNCIGHFNHRYFYLTAVYILIGVIYIMIFGVELAFRHVFLEQDILSYSSTRSSSSSNNESQLQSPIPGPVQLSKSEMTHQHVHMLLRYFFRVSYTDHDYLRSHETAPIMFGLFEITRFTVKSYIYVTGFLCVGAAFALGGLAWWHGRLISNGETSIEFHINKKNRAKDASYVNLYDLGRKRNWELFLGLDQAGRSFWRHILLPSTHRPTGDGYEWSHILRHTLKPRVVVPPPPPPPPPPALQQHSSQVSEPLDPSDIFKKMSPRALLNSQN